MLTILLLWIVTSLTTICFGDILAKLWNKISKQQAEYSLTDLFWIGLATVAMLACAISLISPLNIYVQAAFAAIASAYWIFHRKRLSSICGKAYRFFTQASSPIKILSISVTLLILIYSLLIPTGYDINLYHLQTLAWGEQYAVVPGLGNLHGRLSFNSTSLLLYNIFSYNPQFSNPNFAINGLCCLVFSFWIIKRITERKNIWEVVGLYLTLFIFYFAFVKGISSSSTDLLVNIIVLYLLLKLVLEPRSAQQAVLIFLILPLSCITLKISSLFVFLISLPILFHFAKSRNYRLLSAYILLAAFIMLPWIARFVVMSGYLIYPFPAIDIFTFDWKIPLEIVSAEKESISAYAKISFLPHDTVSEMSIIEWGPIWFKNLSKIYALSYVLMLLSPCVWIYTLIKKQAADKNLLRVWAVAMMGSIFGLAVAPDPRFNLAFLLCAFIIPIFFMLKIDVLQNKKKMLNIIACSLVLVLIVKAGWDIKPYQKSHWISLAYKPQDFHYVKKYFDPHFERHDIDGKTIYSPLQGDQCFDFCIPCTPYYRSGLEFRGSSEKDGFRIK